MIEGTDHIALTVGMLLAGSLAAGLLADVIRLPKVTAYLLAGVTLSYFHLVPEEHMPALEPLTKLAMALVLFHLGSQFPLDSMKRIARRALPMAAGELITTLVVVVGGLALFGWFTGRVNGYQALVLGTLALATAPATTILVLRETQSEGPVTKSIGVLVTLNNVVAVVAFELAIVFIHLMQDKLNVPWYTSVWQQAVDLIASVLLGVGGGLVLSYGCAMLGQRRWLVLLVSASMLLLGLSETLEVPYMLTFIVLGMTVVNSSDATPKMGQELDKVGGLLTVVFFAVHGAELKVDQVAVAGVVGLMYLLLRCFGKVVGVSVAARWTHQTPAVSTWVGPSLLAQAGAAISLAATIDPVADPELGSQVLTVILGTVVVFEIIGPLLVRQAVLRSGEMPLANTIHHTSLSSLDAILGVFRRFFAAFGWEPKKRDAAGLKVSDLMRRNVDGIPQSADFDEVVHFIEHSHDNTYPVLDADGCVVGLIRYRLMSEAFFDPTIDTLVRAEDLTTPAGGMLHPDDPVGEAVELFRILPDDCIPVVTRDEPQRFTGVIRRSDLTNFLIRDRSSKKDGGGGGH